MLDTILSDEVSVLTVCILIGVALVCGLISAFIFSTKLRTSKGFLITISLMPTVVTITFSFLNVIIASDTTQTISKIAVVMVGLGLIRFRSAQGKAEEMLALFISVSIGIVSSLGYWFIALVISIVLPLIYVMLAHFDILSNKRFLKERLLKITIPENLEYDEVFDETFKKYLKEVEMIGVKTTGMGSMFRLSYRIIFNDKKEEKEFIDKIRERNGNLEVSILPFVLEAKEL